MKNLFIAIFLPLCAQQLQVSTPKVQVYPGEVVTITYSLSGTSNLAALQWDGPLVLATTTISGKSIDCNLANGRCIFWGFNSDVIPNGQIAAQSITAPSSIGATVTVILSNVSAATKDGSYGVLSAGPSLLLTVIPFVEDLNGDGKIDIDDALLVIAQAKGLVACGNADLNHDGKCDIVDLQALVNKAQ